MHTVRIKAGLAANREMLALYGARVFADLAEESCISSRSLHECVQFYRCFPIVRGHAQLRRTHYALLCQVGELVAGCAPSVRRPRTK